MIKMYCGDTQILAPEPDVGYLRTIGWSEVEEEATEDVEECQETE